MSRQSFQNCSKTVSKKDHRQKKDKIIQNGFSALLATKFAQRGLGRCCSQIPIGEMRFIARPKMALRAALCSLGYWCWWFFQYSGTSLKHAKQASNKVRISDVVFSQIKIKLKSSKKKKVWNCKKFQTVIFF